jgi:hypothetical protein
MIRKNALVPLCFSSLGLAALAATFALAQPAKDTKPGAPARQPDAKQPSEGMTPEMEACIAAGTPGEMHKFLANGAGDWRGKTTMWMAPGAPPATSDTTFTLTPIMEGRYVKGEMKGEMPGMGPYHGSGVYGFDNVSQKFVSNWIDSHSTGIMNGTGELSADKKTLTWTFTYNCPVTKKPTTMREVERFTSENSRTLEMYGADPTSGKEFKMMQIEMTRK